jgi:hypothetical protein
MTRRALLMSCLVAAACSSAKPTMRLQGVEIAGVELGGPARLTVRTMVWLEVFNPNSYDVAIRALRGEALVAGNHALPVDFRAEGTGAWLPSKQTTRVGIPVHVPAPVGLAVARAAYGAPTIPFHFRGKADVVATSTLQLERDDYAVDAKGAISREQLERALDRFKIPGIKGLAIPGL